MAAPAGQTGPKLLLFLGGTLAALAGAFTGMGVPIAPDPRELTEIESPTRPLLAPTLSGEGPPSPPARTSCRELAKVHKPDSSLAGRLLGPSGPVAQAPVALVPLPLPGQPERARLIQLTGLDGSFSFRPQEEAQGSWAFHFQVPGFGLQVRPVPPQGAPGPGDIQLAYGRWLPGRVYRQGGTPLPGARILVGLPLDTPEGPRVLWTESGLSGPEGSFVARDLPPGDRVLLLGEHPECAPAVPMEVWTPVGSPAGELTLVLPGGIDLAGLVVDKQGNALPRTRIGWKALHAGGLNLRRDAITCEEGRFLLAGLPRDTAEWPLELIGPRGERNRLTLQAGSWSSGVRIQLPW